MMSGVKSTGRTKITNRRSKLQIECDENLKEDQISDTTSAETKTKLPEKHSDTATAERPMEDFHASTESLHSIENTNKRSKRGAAIIASSRMTKSPSVIQKERSKISKLKGDELDEVITSTKQKFNQFQDIFQSLQMKKRCRSFDSREKSSNEVKNKKDDEFSSPPPIGVIPSFSSQQATKKVRLTNRNEENELKFNSLDDLTTEPAFKSNKMSRTSSRSSSPCSIDLNYKLIPDTCPINSYSMPTENEHENTKSSILPGEINQVDAFTFKSVTFVVDSRKTKQDKQSISNQFYVLYLIEKIHEYHEELCDSQSTLFVSVYDINSNEITDSGKPSVLEIFLKQKFNKPNGIELSFLDDFDKSFQSDLVISLVEGTNSFNETNSESSIDEVNHAFERNLFSSDITDVKYICLAKMSYENALFYHYYFKFNNGVFVEAPVLINSGNLNDSNYKLSHARSQIHAACCDSNFYNSTRNIFNLTETGNIFDKKSQIGLPNMYFNSIQPVISQSRTILKELAQKLPKLSDVKDTSKGNEKKQEEFERRKQLYLETICTDLKRDFNKEVDLVLMNLNKAK